MASRLLLIGRLLCCCLVGWALIGCAGGEDAVAPASVKSADAPPSTEEADSPAAEGKPGAGGSGVSPARKADGLPRKIIYTADVTLVVEKLTPAQRNLTALVTRYKGYIAETNIGGETGSPRQGRWKVRIPVDGYQSFLDAVTKIGEVQTVSSTSQDVSEEYYDIEARLRNKRLEEKRLLEHLNRSTAKLDEILKVEKEISRVRGEIEQMEGRLRVLASLTAMTTITVTINEVKDYVPPAPPTFGTEMARTFNASLGALGTFGKGLVLFLIALLPWLVGGSIVGLPIWLFLQRRAKPKGP